MYESCSEALSDSRVIFVKQNMSIVQERSTWMISGARYCFSAVFDGNDRPTRL